MSNDKIDLLVFDAYGTLFDINFVTMQHSGSLGPIAQSFSDLWRSKQLEYSWLQSLMGCYENFWTITERALDYTMDNFGIDDATLKERLLGSYEVVSCYPEVPEILSRLREKGRKLVILSNANVRMLDKAVNNAGISTFIDSSLSTESVRIFKPHPIVYQMVLEKYDTPKENILFISSNSWDAAGAKSFGFNVAWINRFDKKVDHLPVRPDHILHSLRQVLPLVN